MPSPKALKFGSSTRLPAISVPPFTGIWTDWHTFNYNIPRGGNSRILITVSLNAALDIAGLLIGALRCTHDNRERRFWLYRSGSLTNGGTMAIPLDVTGTLPSITLQLIAVDPANVGFSTIGGAGDSARSQILITDLGPL